MNPNTSIIRSYLSLLLRLFSLAILLAGSGNAFAEEALNQKGQFGLGIEGGPVFAIGDSGHVARAALTGKYYLSAHRAIQFHTGLGGPFLASDAGDRWVNYFSVGGTHIFETALVSKENARLNLYGGAGAMLLAIRPMEAALANLVGTVGLNAQILPQNLELNANLTSFYSVAFIEKAGAVLSPAWMGLVVANVGVRMYF